MKIICTLFLLGQVAFAEANAQTNETNSVPQSASTVETIVCIRHGEKPPGGLGQLTCQGLNRALALPKVLLGKFGTPQSALDDLRAGLLAAVAKNAPAAPAAATAP